MYCIYLLFIFDMNKKISHYFSLILVKQYTQETGKMIILNFICLDPSYYLTCIRGQSMFLNCFIQIYFYKAFVEKYLYVTKLLK